MFEKAKKWLVCLPTFTLMFTLVFCCGLLTTAWAAVSADDSNGDASQSYAIYSAGQSGDEDLVTGDRYESVPGYLQDDPENKPTDSEENSRNNENNNSENNNSENNNNNNNNDDEPDNQGNDEPRSEPKDEPEQTPDADFPELADNLEVLIWDEASQSNQKSRVTPVNLALRGEYLPSDVPAMAVSGRTLVPVRLISEQLEAAVVWEKAANTVTISLDDKKIVLTIGSSTALVDGQAVQVPGDVSVSLVTYEGTARTMVPVRFVSESLDATVNYDAAQRMVNIVPPVRVVPEPEPEDEDNIWYNRPITPGGNYENELDTDPELENIPPPGIDENGKLLRRVVIDPGHGGIDPGTSGHGRQEKDINLAVSLKLQQILENDGFEVFMARSDDSYVALLDRAALTVQEDAPVFVSIHCNSAANIPSASGIETYAAPDDADDAELAAFIQKEVIAATGAKDRGVKTSPLIVLIHNAAPGCLVEIGFMSNSAECARIADAAYQQKLAAAVAAGVEAYFEARNGQ